MLFMVIPLTYYTKLKELIIEFNFVGKRIIHFNVSVFSKFIQFCKYYSLMGWVVPKSNAKLLIDLRYFHLLFGETFALSQLRNFNEGAWPLILAGTYTLAMKC